MYLIILNFYAVFFFVKDGDKFWRMPECYVRGSTIKYLRLPDEVIDLVKDEVVARGRGRGDNRGRPSGRGGRGGGPGRGAFGGLLMFGIK